MSVTIKFTNIGNGVVPSRAHDTDTGWDLTGVRVKSRRWLGKEGEGPELIMYGTDLKVQPLPGYYLEIAPRSSLSKTGHILANSVGIIDESYRGELFIAAVKLHPSVPDLPLPHTLFQLVCRKRENMNFVEVKELDETVRGSGGFGSTNSNNFTRTAYSSPSGPYTTGMNLSDYLRNGELRGC